MLKFTDKNSRGDTIVEVLLAITIASLAIGVTYATAQRGLDQTISARERNQALNLIQNQITELQLRFQSNSAAFAGAYGWPNNHFCLDDTNPPYKNDGPGSPGNLSSTLSTKLSGPYDPSCKDSTTGFGTIFFYDIVTTPPPNPTIPTTFQVFVRWEPVGSGHVSQASVYYRPNGATTQILGYVAPRSLPRSYAYRRVSNDA